MAQTPEEKQAELVRARQQRGASYLAKVQATANPNYGGNMFEPDSYIPTADPNTANPLPSGRYVDPRLPTPVALERAKQMQEFANNPRKFVQEKAPELANEQSLLDKGKTMLGRIFDYQDEADANLFGINLSAGESVFDGFVRRFVGSYDLLNIGIGALISAAPGGVRTLEYGELSGNKSIGEVLNGEMVPGSAPSPGQIAISSVAIEAKRIREGGARLSDILLLNPATAPFILAGMAAETSPLQKKGFDLLDKEQREEAFGSGWEQWMSGVTDAGLAFADPLIGAGVATKVVRAGLLGQRSNLRYAKNFAAVDDDLVDELTTHFGDPRKPADIYADMDAQGIGFQANTTPDGMFKYIKETGEIPERDVRGPQIRHDTVLPESDNPLFNFYTDVLRQNADGTKKMSVDEIAARPEIRALDQTGSFAAMLHDTRGLFELSLLMQAVTGTAESMSRLSKYRPALADMAFRLNRQRAGYLAQWEPTKVTEAVESLSKKIANINDEISGVQEQINKIAPDGKIAKDASPEELQKFSTLTNHSRNLEHSKSQLETLSRVVKQEEDIDKMDPNNPFYDKIKADEIEADLLQSVNLVQPDVVKQIQAAALSARFQMPVTTNAYARAVTASRARRGEAAYQYGAEKTSILPKKAVVLDDGTTVREATGWFAASQFDGVSRLQRSVRVWRWLGTETPSGWIGLKGTATVGSEREFKAATDLEMYRSKDPIIVKRKVPTQATDTNGKLLVNADGSPKMLPESDWRVEEISVGGQARRDELFAIFYRALNNPDEDSLNALQDVEAMIMDDYALLYGHNLKAMKDVLARANKNRAQDLELMRTRGYFVDEDKTVHYVPYLETHLANGTYMQNFQALEKILKEDAVKTGGQRIRATLETPMHLAGSAYGVFNDFWRPATLMRFSYTQRNVFEGMVRAMAYSASLAPLSWPVRATTNGIVNAVNKRVSAKYVAKGRAAIEAGDIGDYVRAYDQAATDEYYVRSAVSSAQPDDVEPMVLLLRRTPGEQTAFERIPVTEWEVRRDAAHTAYRDAEEALRANESKFTSSVEGTRFGKWRKQSLETLDAAILANDKTRLGILEALEIAGEEGLRFEILSDPQIFQRLADLVEEGVILAKKKDAIRYSPSKAIEEYQAIAGRQRRIGSGSSMAPDGNYYGDGFTGPLEQINRKLMSADTTNKQSLSLTGNVYGNIFQKILIRDNTPVAYLGNEDAWVNGVVTAIEDASSSRVVQKLVENNFDVEATIAWMTSGEREAKTFTQQIMKMFGSSPTNPAMLDDAVETASTVMSRELTEAKSTRLTPFAESISTPSGRAEVAYDTDLVRAYVTEVSQRLLIQMQGNNELIGLLRQRINQKTASRRVSDVAALQSVPSERVDPKSVKAIIDGMTPEQRAKLSPIQGAEVIQMGTDSVMRIWANFADKMFRLLGTIPEDAVTRGPFYNMRYKATRNDLIEQYWATQGMTSKEVKAKNKAAKGSVGQTQGMTLEHPEFKIPASELSRIEVQAHRRALKDTKEWMYTIDRRTNLGKYGEVLFPFISAQQNSMVVVGKLLWKEPWLAPAVADLWRMPSRLGFEDEEGNLTMPMPLGWAKKMLEDNPDIPFLGGVVSSMDTITIPKNGLNVWMPETGFGLLPRPTPWIQVGASELMKANAFPIETPEIVKRMFGEELGTSMYQSVKDYMFGEEGTMSATTLSVDKLIPAWTQKLIQMKSELSAQYGYQYALQMHTQNMRFRARERDTAPTEAEIAKRTTNMFWFYALGNLGVPTPLTPYPILTRPQVKSEPLDVVNIVAQNLKKIDPLNANLNLDRLLGDWAIEASLTKVSRNVGGANPTSQTVSDINTFAPLIRKISPDLGDNLDVLGILINNRGDMTGYEDAAYQWQKSATIPGTNREYREVQSPEQALAERQRVVGWTIWRGFMDQLDARLHSAGLDNYELAAAAPYKAAKQRQLANMMNNPDYAGWVVDYQDIGGNRTGAAVRVLQAAITDETFQTEMFKSGKENTLRAMTDYVKYRNAVINAVDQSGNGINHESNKWIKDSWATIRQNLKNSDVRWGEISNLYLSGDDDPKNPGQFFDRNMPIPEGLVQGVTDGR